MFERIRGWFRGVNIVELPSDFKFIIVSVGDKDNPVTMQQIDDMRAYVELCIECDIMCIGLPHWVKLTVMK